VVTINAHQREDVEITRLLSAILGDIGLNACYCSFDVYLICELRCTDLNLKTASTIAASVFTSNLAVVILYTAVFHSRGYFSG